VIRVAQSLVFCVVFCVLYPVFYTQNTTQKTRDWATRTTLKTNDKQRKILHRKIKIGQHEPHFFLCSILGCLSWVFSVLRVVQSLVFCGVFCVVYRWFYSVVRVAQSLVFCVVFCVTLKTNNKPHKILHRKLQIGQHEPH
jgi:uncharacterized membrane protein YqjE